MSETPSGTSDKLFPGFAYPTPEIQMPVSAELLIILNIDNPQSLGHADIRNIFSRDKKCYSLPSKDVIGHIKRGLEHYRDLLARQKVRGESPFIEMIIDDPMSLDTWRIRYELREDGTIAKIYTDTENEAQKFEVTMDAAGNLQLPKLKEGESFSLECYGDKTGPARLAVELTERAALRALSENPSEKA